MDKEDKSIQQMSEPLSSPSAGHLMDMGPNEKYFKHMKQTSGEREKRIKLNAGRSRREQAKEVVTPQCLLSVCLCVCTKGPLVPAYLLGKLAPKESKVSFGISSCLSSRLQGNLTICPPGIEKLSSLLKNEEVVTPSGKQSQPSASPTMSDAPIHLSFLWSFTGLAPGCSCLSCTEEPTTGPRTPDVASPGLHGGEESPPLTCWPRSSLHSHRCCWQPLLQKHIAGSCTTCCPPGHPLLSDV
ncbi:uncharacterized protein [Ciconia boyciana]|uniref:uncharacterized protein isoform X1 n=1 Tax=Ciconia boyciana TaxID=52775 RepID=UPI003BA33672